MIVALLQKNARISNRELARAAGIAESTCLDRVRSLERRGVIVGYHAEVDLAAVGRSVRALITVRLQPKTTESVRSFQRSVLEARETLSVRTVSGADDFIVEEDNVVIVSRDGWIKRQKDVKDLSTTRLREGGKHVFGMGEKKTPMPFIKACEQFIYIELLRAPRAAALGFEVEPFSAIPSMQSVLDSTPIYDAVTTEDTITQLRAAIRKMLDNYSE